MYNYDYSQQLIKYLLPELTLIIMISYVLTTLAIELGQGRSKKKLAIESLHDLNFGLSFVLALYILQLLTALTSDAAALFNGYLLTNQYITIFKVLTVLSGRFILYNSWLYVTKHKRHLLEYPVVLTLAILFMLLLISSGHLISAFLTLVGFSLNLYVLILFDAPTAIAREAGIKYFYLSAFSSGLMIYGIFLLFLSLNTGHFVEIGQILATAPEVVSNSKTLVQYAILFLLVGLFFKLSAFPGHLWAAEVYEGSPDPIAAFFMLPVKVAVLAFVLQLLVTALEPVSVFWQPIVALSAICSLIWGCFAALVEKKTKRFLAYASINQIGFLLLGVATNSYAGYRATLLYLFIYAVMNMGFLQVFLNTRRTEDGMGLLYLTDFRGIGQKYWILSWSIAVILLSMAGIPPLAGFFGKYYLLMHAQEQGLYALVITALATSLVSTYYYLRLIKIFWFEGTTAMTETTVHMDSNSSMSLFYVEGLLWSFILFAGYIIGFADVAATSLVKPLING